MKRLLLCLAALPLLATAEPDLRTQLRDALYTEEVERNPTAAAEAYEKILAGFDSQRPLAASALFRLAEVRRKQERKDDAIALYQRLLQEFPEFEAETKLAGQHLADLGGKLPTAEPTLAHEEAAELHRLKGFAKSAPDILLDPVTLTAAIDKGWPEVVKFLLSQGAPAGDSDALPRAASAGRIDLCRILIEHGDLSENAKTRALFSSISENRVAVLKFLLENDFDANTAPEGTRTLLIHAVDQRNPDMVTLLLDHGADINFTVDSHGVYNRKNPFGSALHQAVIEGHEGIFNLLLERGAAPDQPAPKTNLTPLHFAITSYTEASRAFTATLLAKGADPNRQTGPVNAGPNSTEYPSTYYSVRPLQLAARSAAVEKTKALLEAGAEIMPQDLVEVTQESLPSHLELYLPRVPRFTADDPAAQALLSIALGRKPELVRLLIAHGAAPSQSKIDELFPRVPHELRPDLNQSYLLPKLTKQPKIQLLLDQGKTQGLVTLADSSIASSPPSLSQAILENTIGYMRAANGETIARWILWRQDESGTLHSTDINFKENDPFPVLEWGDVIERRIVNHETTTDYVYSENLLPTLLWEFTRRISIPITITLEGETREFTVRGDRLSYDPTKLEFPYISTEKIVTLLRPEIPRTASGNDTVITIQRKGWHDTVAAYGSDTIKHFKLEPGDHLTLDSPTLSPEEATEFRKRSIALRIPGTHYAHFIDAPESPAAAPSLMEVLGQLYAGESWGFTRQRFESIPTESGAKLGTILRNQKNKDFATPVVLPHPDLAQLKIHRLASDGSDSTISVDLAKLIAESTEASTPEQIRSADIPLLAGDIIHLTLKSNDQPWTGFSPKQASYFHKALSGSIQITFREGRVARHPLDWQPTHWTPTAAGLLPLPPEKGTASTRAVELGFNTTMDNQPELVLTRDNKYQGDVGFQAILRDGDRVIYAGAARLGEPMGVPRRASAAKPTRAPVPTQKQPTRTRYVPRPPSR